MSRIQCMCGSEVDVPIERFGQPALCDHCRQPIRCVAATAGEQSEFLARLVVESGPEHIGEQIFLSGPLPIPVGKAPERPLCLAGATVSRHHCTLIPLDDGVWRVEDHNSRNGLYANGQRTTSHDLRDGDLLTVGDYTLRFHCPTAAESPATGEIDLVEEPVVDQTAIVAPIAQVEPGGPVCPSCNQSLAVGSKICVSCGIDLKTGRPLVISRGIDENVLYHNVQTLVWWVSWFEPIGIFPIASEAYGRFKPRAIQAITILTVLVTALVWLINYRDQSGPFGATKNLMLWSGSGPPAVEWIRYAYTFHDPASEDFRRREQAIIKREEDIAIAKRAAAETAALAALAPATQPVQRKLTAREVQTQLLLQQMQHMAQLREAQRRRMEGPPPPPPIDLSANEIAMEAYHQLPPEELKVGAFQPYQLVTHAFLHAGMVHLLGNMVFLLVFGNRINALLGQWKAALLYIVLAIIAGGAYFLSRTGLTSMPMLGASGAIMGMAGMYFILMPVSKVHMVLWIRPILAVLLVMLLLMTIPGMLCFSTFLIVPLVYILVRMAFSTWIRTFALRGYWVLLFFIAFDVWATVRGSHDTTAHWAHLGGFLGGMLIALTLLLTRQVNAHGGDMISLLLGARAWKILGTPEERLA